MYDRLRLLTNFGYTQLELIQSEHERLVHQHRRGGRQGRVGGGGRGRVISVVQKQASSSGIVPQPVPI
jgi:hypothetical protein